MITKEELEKRVLEDAKRKLVFWTKAKQEDPGVTIDGYKKENARLAAENYKEMASIKAVRYIERALDLYSNNAVADVETRTISDALGIKEDEMSKIMGRLSRLDLKHTKHYQIWDQKVQEIYEMLGFTDKLPTHTEIRNLESQLKQAKATGKSETQLLELEKIIQQKKNAIAEGPWEFEFPNATNKSIEEKYDRRIAEVQELENSQGRSR